MRSLLFISGYYQFYTSYYYLFVLTLYLVINLNCYSGLEGLI